MKIIIPLVLVFIIAFAAYSILHKKNPKMGGEIALSKKLWLFYTIWTWFILIPFVLFFELANPAYLLAWGGFSLLMWMRGIVEIYMLYVTKNWTPPIGITHDIFCFFWLVFTTPIHQLLIWSNDSFFHLSLILSIIAETYYAYAFFKIVGKKTKGEEPIWFAGKSNPAFRRVLLVTSMVNWIVFPVMILYILNNFHKF